MMERYQLASWYIFLNKTIEMWEKALKTGEKDLCPLCEAYRKRKGKYIDGHPNKETCKKCIHLSELGQGIPCVEQKSYKDIQLQPHYVHYDPKNRWHIKYRISYLKKIKEKILNAMVK
jgi:hypothetical protein